MSDYSQFLSMPVAAGCVRRQRRPRCRAPRGLNNDQLKTWRRQRASGRELQRIHELREAFDILRTVIPRQADDDKYSKVQVLKYAISYIKLLKEICVDKDCSTSSSSWSDCTNSPPPSYSSSYSSGSEPGSPYGLDWSCFAGDDRTSMQAQQRDAGWQNQWTQPGNSSVQHELDDSLFADDLEALLAATTSLASYPSPCRQQSLPAYQPVGQFGLPLH